MTLELHGRARRLGDHVNTDYIISSSRKKETLDPHRLKRWLLEATDPGFAKSVEPGDMLVAGRAFGSGSAMEVAVTVVKAAGIDVVLATSFSRTYFRNAINNGLLPVECDTTRITEGDHLTVRVEENQVTVAVVVPPGGDTDAKRDDDAKPGPALRPATHTLVASPYPPFILEIFNAGGLAPYLRVRGGFGNSP